MNETFRAATSKPSKKKIESSKAGKRGFYTRDGFLYFRKGEDEIIKVSSELRVMALACDERGDDWQYVVEARTPDGGKREFFIRKAELDGGKYRTALLSGGVTIFPAGRNHLDVFILEQEPQARVVTVSRTGWQGQCFVMPHRTIFPDGYEGPIWRYADPNREQGSTNASGALEEWKNQIASKCAGNSRLILSVSYAFAAILATRVDRELLGININGDSSKGKTTALRVAASVVAGPSYILSWNATGNALMSNGLRRNDLPYFLDELGQADARTIGVNAYNLTNGVERGRCNIQGDARTSRKFNTGVLSTGEKNLESIMRSERQAMASGQDIRLSDLPADAGQGFGIFDTLHGAANGAALSDELKESAKRLYGTAGEEFIRKVAGDQGVLADEFKFFESAFKTKHVPAEANSVIGRVCSTYALAAFAGEKASEWNITGWNSGEAEVAASRCFQDWLKIRPHITDSREKSGVVESLMDYLGRFGRSRFRTTEDDRIPDESGWREEHAGQEPTFMFTGHALKEALSGHDFNRAKQTLCEKGILSNLASKNKRNPYTQGQMKVYEIRLPAFAESEETRTKG